MMTPGTMPAADKLAGGRRLLELATAPTGLGLPELETVILVFVGELTRRGMPAPLRVVTATIGVGPELISTAVGSLVGRGLVERSHYGHGEARQRALTTTVAGAVVAARLRAALEEPS
jgi:hypothetical protein